MGLKLLQIYRKLKTNLSFRAGLYCMAAIAATLFSVSLSPLVPGELSDLLGGEAVDRILTIMASSLLAVVTFSLATLVTSYANVNGSAPSRATALVIGDPKAHSALSTFLGGFIFSVVSLTALSTKYYGADGRVILFFITIAVLSVIIWKIITWIGQLSTAGRLEHVMRQVHDVSKKTIQGQIEYFSWNQEAFNPPPTSSLPIESPTVGFVQTIDYKKLSKIADSIKKPLHILLLVGDFVTKTSVVAKIETDMITEDIQEKILSCFLFGSSRTFEDDPRFGLIVLSEVGSRALSPGINDPGTAIQVLGHLTQLLYFAIECKSDHPKTISSDYLRIRPITCSEIFDDAFRAIARDGSPNCEVSIFLQKSLASLSHIPEYAEAAAALSAENISQCETNMTSRNDIKRVKKAATS
ncbi:DUF2254 domain-containing protein [Bdellovibrio sp. ZAP7]|uniref:DUF2254 domain-containing protein n=1 Tax=Bdellovibrio sp. ZAP7 TaxID=2231053 RepID=UPI00143D80B2|nr:DUF2254 domain-containing protein [Bdellovibrio sp. ZAP7]